MRIRSVVPADHSALIELWRRTEGLRLRPEDEAGPFAAYLARNPGLSLALDHQGVLVGSLMAGHDGRRGYLQHLVVAEAYRRQGWARRLLDEARRRLAEQGIEKCHVFVLRDADASQAFWTQLEGWAPRTDITVYSTGGSR